MKALVVEDDFVSRLFLQKMLQEYGVCDAAVNGIEAVQAFNIAFDEGHAYDLICLDIMMPEMDGKEALKIIREREKDLKVPPRDEVKIVMVTALDTAKDVIDAYYRGGCTAYLVKPIFKTKLVNMLKELAFIE